MRKFYTALAVMAIVFAVSPVSAQGKGMPGGRDDRAFASFANADMLEKMSTELKLTDKQLAEIKTVTRNAEKEAVDLKAAVKKARMDLLDALGDAKATNSDIRKAAETVDKNEQALSDNGLATMLAVREILTVQQRTAVIEHMKNARDERHGEMNNMPPMQGNTPPAPGKGCPMQQGGMPHKGCSGH